MKTEKYILPEYYACALINDDRTGLDEDDIKLLDSFIERNKKKNRMFYCIDADLENGYFSYTNHVHNLGCEVCEFTFNVSRIVTKNKTV